MRIGVASERCIGAGNCVDVAPKYFDQSDAVGIVEVLVDEVDPEDEDKVAEAADICPVAAILLSAGSPAR
jgi:ferredoxin